MQSLQLGIVPASAVTRGLQKIEILLDIQYVKSSSERKKQYRGKRPNKNKRHEIKSKNNKQGNLFMILRLGNALIAMPVAPYD